MLGSYIQQSIFGAHTPLPAVLSFYQQRQPFRLPVSLIDLIFFCTICTYLLFIFHISSWRIIFCIYLLVFKKNSARLAFKLTQKFSFVMAGYSDIFLNYLHYKQILDQ